MPEQVSCVLAPCSWNKDCESCIQASSFGESCHWCRRDNSCHSSISIFNSCRQADNVVLGGQDQCSTPMRTFNTTLANLTLAASISAHFQHGDPSLCMSTMLPESDFVVTRTHEGKCHEDFQSDQCYGYNAISHKERAILIAFRGTIDWNQGMSEIITTLLYSKSDFLDGSVQNYFYNAFINVWPPLEADLIQLRLYYPNYRVLVTGFSLGGAIASLASAFIVFNGLADNSQVFLYTFGMPRVGDYAYATYHDQLVPNSWRIVRQKDPIPQVPSKIQIGNWLSCPLSLASARSNDALHESVPSIRPPVAYPLLFLHVR